MAKKIQKLELTWAGKDAQIRPEPRILMEDKARAYGDTNSENMLIHGDNLLALKSLESDFAGQVKCIYIDPPYNTGNAFEHYDDGYEHSIWLSLMRDRLEILRNLLTDDGMIFVQIDDEEQAYLKVIMDEVFGRNNFRECIALKTSTPSGVNAVNVKRGERLFKLKEYILFYSKEPTARFYPLYIKSDFNPNYKWEVKKENGKYIVTDLSKTIAKDKLESYVLKNPENIYSLEKNNQKAGDKVKQIIEQSKTTSEVIEYVNTYGKLALIYNGGGFVSLNDRVVKDGEGNSFGVLISDFWDDQIFQTNKTEGGVEFKASKKPEKLIQRIMQLSTKPGDLVLDSFLGSGTTAAVAHKMGRRWIGIELGDHAYTHCFARMKAVVDGEQGGTSKSVNWGGGGGFKFYELASSLIIKDEEGNLVISKEYNGDMLAEAMCKLMGYKYAPDKSVFWKQGKGTEKNYIFTTTMVMTAAYLEEIQRALGNDSLTICCSAFVGNPKAHPNITIKRIPQEVLSKCEWNKPGYPLPVREDFTDEDFEFEGVDE